MPEAQEQSLNQTIESLVAILIRRRWWVLLATCGTVAATFVVLSRIPNRYVSEATLLVVQQQIPQRYVLPTTTTDIREVLQATTQEVLSRTRLLEIIDQFGLYTQERTRVSPEGLLDLMRHDIDIQPLDVRPDQRDVNSFKISFTSSNPHVAQEVTSKLTSLFIEQNLETRERQANTTTNFLQEQLESARKKLADAEEQVRAFKMAHIGELPEQQAGNLAILAGLQSQLQNTMAGLNRAREQKEYLESLSGYQAMSAESDLARLKAERATLLERYTPLYPAVVRLDEKIARAEASLNVKLGQPAGPQPSGPNVSSPSPIIAPDDPALGQLHSQLEANRLEIANLSNDEKRLKDSIELYQKRLNATPVREQQLAGINRNYDLLKQDYADLLNKEMQSQLAADLEKRQEGQQFRLIDRPSLPSVPTSPNRVKFSLVGVAVGLGIGLALSFLLEIRDDSFHSEEALSKRFALPLVISVPLLLTAGEERSRTWRRTLEWVAGSALALAVCVAELYQLYLFRHG